MSFVSQLIAAAVGGGVGGSFVLWGVNVQFRRQSAAACRALLLEVQANYEALAEMVNVLAAGAGWVVGKPNPGWLHRSVWDAQLPYVVQLLSDDHRTLELVARAYGTLDAFAETRQTNFAGYGIPYAHGGWIDAYVSRAYDAFRPAKEYLGDFVARCDQPRDLMPNWVRRGLRWSQRKSATGREK